MQFLVPQFIDIEDKIIGPLTLKQFLYLGVAGGIVFLSFLIFELYVAMVILPIVGGLGLAFAFYKVNGRDFIYFIDALMNFFLKPRLYIWKREFPKKTKKKEPVPRVEEKKILPTPKLTKSRLKKLAWQLDIMKKQK